MVLSCVISFLFHLRFKSSFLNKADWFFCLYFALAVCKAACWYKQSRIFQRLSKSLHSTIFLFGYQMNRTTADYGECKQDPSFNLRFITKHAFITWNPKSHLKSRDYHMDTLLSLLLFPDLISSHAQPPECLPCSLCSCLISSSKKQ